MSEKRLAWLHLNFVSGGQGGAGRAIYLVAAALSRGWQVDLVTSRRGYLDAGGGEGGAADRMEQDGGLTVHRLDPPRGLSTLADRAGAYRWFGRRALGYALGLPAPRVVFASSPPLPVLLPALALAARRGASLVVELRDLWPAFLVDGGHLRSRSLIRALEGLEALAVHAADEVVSVAPAFTAYLEALGVPSDRIVTAPTGADPAFREVDPAAVAACRRRHGLEGPLLVYAGTFNENSGVEAVLAAAERDRGQGGRTWVIAGGGRLREQVEDAARRLPNLRYLGLVPRQELPALYAASELALLPRAPWRTQATVMPAKLFDYLASGCPVVCVAAGQPAALVRAAGAGVVPGRGGADGLLEGVEALMARTEAERRALGRAGQRWVLTRMNAYASAERVLDAVERAEAGTRPRWGRRLARAAAHAAASTARGASTQALGPLVGPDQEEAIDAAFARWLAETPPSAEDRRLPMPRLLWDATGSGPAPGGDA